MKQIASFFLIKINVEIYLYIINKTKILSISFTVIYIKFNYFVYYLKYLKILIIWFYNIY